MSGQVISLGKARARALKSALIERVAGQASFPYARVAPLALRALQGRLAALPDSDPQLVRIADLLNAAGPLGRLSEALYVFEEHVSNSSAEELGLGPQSFLRDLIRELEEQSPEVSA